MTIRQMEYIIALSETGSFSKAAKRLFVSQPSISQYVQKLEAELGMKLFERTTPLRLTYAGELYVAYAREVLKRDAEMHKMFRDLAEGSVGRIVMAASQYYCQVTAPRMLERFLARYPDVTVSLLGREAPALLPMVRQGRCDFAIVGHAVAEPDLVSVHLGQERFVLVVPEQTARRLHLPAPAPGGPFPQVELGQFQQERFAALTADKTGWRLLRNVCMASGFTPRRTTVTNTVQACMRLVESGLCVSYLPDSVFDVMDRERVRFYRLARDVNRRNLYLIHTREKFCSQPMLEMFRILQQVSEPSFLLDRRRREGEG